MCEPRLEWSRDPALETTAQELYLAWLVLSGISPRYGHQSPHLYLVKTSNPHIWVRANYRWREKADYFQYQNFIEALK